MADDSDSSLTLAGVAIALPAIGAGTLGGGTAVGAGALGAGTAAGAGTSAGTVVGGSSLGAFFAPVTAALLVLLYPRQTIVSDDAEREMLNASKAARSAADSTLIAAATASQMGKIWDDKEGDGTRGKTIEEIKEAFKDKLSPGELKKLLQKVEKFRGNRNKEKDSRKKL